MESKQHSDKVITKAEEKQAHSQYRCANCGETFVSESEKRKHEISHLKKQVKKQEG